MNIESLIFPLSQLMSKLFADVKSKVSGAKGIDDPAKTLEIQFAIQQYSNAVNLESALIKVFKDLFYGIISKI